MYVPVQGVLSAAFKRIMYQVMEYDQIFQSYPDYPYPLEYGFKEIGHGIISPILNEDFEDGNFYSFISASQIATDAEVKE